MKVHELIAKLMQFDLNMEVGSSGHYGELLNIESVHLSYAEYRERFVDLEIESAGEEPD
jgi:hypothetical protein